jgi:serine/threonine protein kinase/protein tyrosine phosphatase (PTP) superfamily phosphohydrolase (DUF442 family)
MRRRVVWVGLLVVAGIAFFTVYRGRPEPTPVGLEASLETDRWMDSLREHAEHGYWLVVRGTHPGDQVVAAATAGSLTHAAIYDARRREVVEAVGSGVMLTPVRELVAHSHRLQIVRPRDFTADEGEAAVRRARSRVGFDYDWLGTVGLESDRRFYCTELVLDAYRARERGWTDERVLLPERMEDYGEVVFDSGPRASSGVAAQIGDELRSRFASIADEARGVDYAAEVAPGLYRGGVPDAEGIEWLKERGVRTVVNLRHYHGDSEGELVRAAGMRYEHLRLESTDAPEPEQVERFLAIVTDPEAQPVYVHCDDRRLPHGSGGLDGVRRARRDGVVRRARAAFRPSPLRGRLHPDGTVALSYACRRTNEKAQEGRMKICTKCKRRYTDDDVGRCPLDGAPLEDLPHAWLGRELDEGCTIESLVVESGITSVLRANGPGGPVIVEVLRDHMAKSPPMVARFQRGATRAASLSHPGIVRTLGQGMADGAPYVITEPLEGAPLGRPEEHGPLPVDQAVRLALAVTEALEHAHNHGVIHRNLKPDNIYVHHRGDGRMDVKIRGFGIASAVGDARMTEAGEVFGTPGYLAPEQAASSEVSVQTDLYALGVILFELLTGRQPYPGDASHVLMIKHVTQSVPRVAETIAVPPALDDLVYHLLQKKPEERPASAAVVRSALEQFVS